MSYLTTFSTVAHLRSGSVPPNWAQLIKNSSELVTEENYNLSRTWFQGIEDPAETGATSSPATEPSTDQSANSVGGNSNAILPSQANNSPSFSTTGSSVNEGGPNKRQRTLNEGDQASQMDSPSVYEGDETLRMPKMVNLQESGLRRSPRIKAMKSIATLLTAIFCTSTVSSTVNSTIEQTTSGLRQLNNAANQFETNFGSTINSFAHHVFAAGKENNESYTFREMLKQDDREDFLTAMEVEIFAHEERDHWEIVPCSEMPQDMKTIMEIWSFKRRRHPDGTLNKHKARLCAHGGMQQWGVNYWETYAPVVNWTSVQFMLIIGQLSGLKTKALDFVLAFPQADLDTPVYMEIPIGVSVDGIHQNKKYVMRLLKSLYGLKQASSNWYSCLKQGLKDRGFKQSQSDACVFIRKDMTILVYVDDCVLVSKSKSVMNDFIDSLKKGPEKFVFTDEGVPWINTWA